MCSITGQFYLLTTYHTTTADVSDYTKDRAAAGVRSAFSGKLLFDGKEEMRHNCAGSHPVYDLPYTVSS
jgi:hypothetical protein